MKNILAILIFTIFVFGCNKDERMLNEFNGTFTVIKHTFNPAYYPMDSYDTITAEIQIVEDGSPTLILSATHSIETGFFEEEESSRSILKYSNRGFPYKKSATLNLTDKTFLFSGSRIGGPGGFTHYTGSID